MSYNWEDYTDQGYYEDETYLEGLSPDPRGFYTPIPHSDGIPHQVVGATGTLAPGTTHPNYKAVNLHLNGTHLKPDPLLHGLSKNHDPAHLAHLPHSGHSTHSSHPRHSGHAKHSGWKIHIGPGHEVSYHRKDHHSVSVAHAAVELKHIPARYDPQHPYLSNFEFIFIPIVELGEHLPSGSVPSIEDESGEHLYFVLDKVLNKLWVRHPNDSAFGYRLNLNPHEQTVNLQSLEGEVDLQNLTPEQKAALEELARQSLIQHGH